MKVRRIVCSLLLAAGMFGAQADAQSCVHLVHHDAVSVPGVKTCWCTVSFLVTIYTSPEITCPGTYEYPIYHTCGSAPADWVCVFDSELPIEFKGPKCDSDPSGPALYIGVKLGSGGTLGFGPFYLQCTPKCGAEVTEPTEFTVKNYTWAGDCPEPPGVTLEPEPVEGPVTGLHSLGNGGSGGSQQ